MNWFQRHLNLTWLIAYGWAVLLLPFGKEFILSIAVPLAIVYWIILISVYIWIKKQRNIKKEGGNMK